MQANETMEALANGLGVQALDHVAIAVRDFQAALPLYRDLLGGTLSEFEEIPDRGFRWLSLRYPNGNHIELLEPVGERGFLQEFLAKRGEGVHHMTFLVADLRRAVERAQAAGLRVVDENYDDPSWQEAFISPRSAHGTVIQLAHTPFDRAERARRWSAHAFLAERPKR
jgi:methylmalonyl-CoA/ethylmalonyl-CoA epimerase